MRGIFIFITRSKDLVQYWFGFQLEFGKIKKKNNNNIMFETFYGICIMYKYDSSVL